ncbi:UDP-Glycosyltransferase/glycogen phosphorylase [Gymnopus androsaceus JB14]|uniref:UDP-Glycosyltransferase/glycogen phosphorylase n=1 Tax=Gymnopus androsaceus JB14 TaxID=1447944 RepID=A0A6A4I439_9AGAR|nr:UDP-Glycosyltransferase/glycogen phosphorylase [Gymnopus androsaceus JB14]
MASKHLLIHVVPSWGHNKPVTALAVFIVRARPDIIVTVLTTNLSYEKFMGELKLKLAQDEFDALMTRIRVIDIAGAKVHPLAPLPEFASAYAALYNGQSLTCNSSGKVFPGLPRPKVAIIDHFSGYAYDDIRAISQKNVPIISLLTVPAGTIVRIFGPRRFGGTAPVEMAIEEGRNIAKAKLNAAIKAISQAPPPSNAGPKPVPPPAVSDYNHDDFEVIDMPGAPPMYSHEMAPQVPIPVVEIFRAMGQIYTPEADGAIDASVTAFDGDMMSALKGWLEPLGQPVYAMAPLALPMLKGSQKNDANVVNFLDKMCTQFGKRSLIYISFGTLFAPPEPEKLWIMINILIATQTPFILTHASPRFQITEEEKSLIHNSGLGMALAWSPQELILTHPVTGWFITHAGWNSVLEALAYKVPLILWPMSADQPINAATLTLIHKAAFELIGVRAGTDGTKPLLRFKDTSYKPSFTVEGVKKEFELLLEKIKGEEGKLVRQNFEVLSDKVGKSWDDGEESKTDLDNFLAKFID